MLVFFQCTFFLKHPKIQGTSCRAATFFFWGGGMCGAWNTPNQTAPRGWHQRCRPRQHFLQEFVQITSAIGKPKFGKNKARNLAFRHAVEDSRGQIRSLHLGCRMENW